MLIAYFALAGLAPFTILLVCTAWSAARRLQQELRPGPLGASMAQLALIAGIDTGFAALLLRSLAFTGHGPRL